MRILGGMWCLIRMFRTPWNTIRNCASTADVQHSMPTWLFSPDGKVVQMVNPKACMECGACQLNCPAKAIKVDSGVGVLQQWCWLQLRDKRGYLRVWWFLFIMKWLKYFFFKYKNNILIPSSNGKSFRTIHWICHHSRRWQYYDQSFHQVGKFQHAKFIAYDYWYFDLVRYFSFYLFPVFFTKQGSGAFVFGSITFISLPLPIYFRYRADGAWENHRTCTTCSLYSMPNFHGI